VRSRNLPRCACCDLPAPLCLGADRAPVRAGGTRVVVVVHHVEARKSSNTGRLVRLLVEDSALRVRGLAGEAAPGERPAGRALVLHPGPDARVLAPEDAAGDALTLLVPDGSWPQAQRIVRRDPWFRGVAAVRLPAVGPSRYRARRNPREGTLCTFEAVAYALGVLHGDAVRDALLARFEPFLARLLALRAPWNAQPQG
jgi:DTW domain-containing protein YfiP